MLNNMFFNSVLLQVKFLIVAFLNFTYSLVPGSYLSRFYLLLFLIKVAKGSMINRGVRFFNVGKIYIGRNSVVNFGCYLDNRRGIYIGDNVGIAHNTRIYTLGHDIEDPYFKTKGAPVCIRDNAFIFSNSLIMPGVTIGEGAVVLAGSVVTKDVDPYTVVGGNPAKIVRSRANHDIRYTQKYNYLFAL